MMVMFYRKTKIPAVSGHLKYTNITLMMLVLANKKNTPFMFNDGKSLTTQVMTTPISQFAIVESDTAMDRILSRKISARYIQQLVPTKWQS
ncbi:hypothetical protein PsorP6_003493 [Peronosclerospora sorghi]|uniref:Uncharacterized protein n=1 Tax=Peronosclerospora sorghi TaxID=230839 RepID=A0ACC0VR92_9STRA|nr:hypothetical protein PsorP6_003493 [Peronosclerospora sorghi]